MPESAETGGRIPTISAGMDAEARFLHKLRDRPARKKYDFDE
jgi:hypothetical protein